ELGQAPVRRIDHQRRLSRGLAGVGLGNRSRDEARVAILGAFLRRGGLLIGKEPAIAELLWTLERRADQVTQRPRPAQVGLAPGRHRLLPRGRSSRLALSKRERPAQHQSERHADMTDCQKRFDHVSAMIAQPLYTLTTR